MLHCVWRATLRASIARGENVMRPVKKAGSRSASRDQAKGFTPEERTAMREHLRELKAESARGRGSREDPDGEQAVLAKIASLPQPDRTLGERLHALIKAHAPELSPKTWYGMPAYARNDKVVCFFQSADKFKVRYATLGFTDQAHLDEGDMWPTAFALKQLTAVEEPAIAALIRKAVS